MDSASDRLTPIDPNEVLLYDVSGGLYRSNMIHADGNLVAVVNDLSMVKDQKTIKVVDLGSDIPQVIAVRNENFIPPEVSGIAVDAQQEMLVVACWQRKTIYYASLKSNTKLTAVPLADHNGISRKQFHIIDGGVLYADLDEKLRLLRFNDPAPPLLLGGQPVGGAGAGFASNGGRVATTTEKKSGTRFEIAVATLPTSPKTLAETGSPIPGTTGEYGLAGNVCISDDGTVFLSGTPGGGIGIGEYLQALHPESQRWQPLVDADRKPIQAIDAVAGVRLMAFKTGGYNEKTRIAYATFGNKIDASQLPTLENATKQTAKVISLEDLTEEEQETIKNYQKG